MNEKHSQSKSPQPRNQPGPRLNEAHQLECTLPDDLMVIAGQRAIGKLFGYAYATDIEVSCLGLVERQGNTFTITDLFLLNQEGTGCHTNLDQNAIGQLVEQLIAAGRKEDTAKIRCWCHSHPGNMGCFWSQTDNATCHLLVADWLVSIVVGSGFRLRCRVDVASPIPFTIDHVPVCLDGLPDEALVAECGKEVQEKVKLASPRLEVGFPLLPPAQPERSSTEATIEQVDYCDLCGDWHGPKEKDCPLSGMPGYKEALAERLAGGFLHDPFGDDFPLGGLTIE